MIVMSYYEDYIDDPIQADVYATNVTTKQPCDSLIGACPTGPALPPGTLFNHSGYWIALLAIGLIVSGTGCRSLNSVSAASASSPLSKSFNQHQKT
jgi:hypothetical protein